MGILDLNYDTLAHILSLISTTDALNVAVSCKQLYPAAIQRTSARVICSTPASLHSAWTCLVDSPHDRARHVRTLRIHIFSTAPSSDDARMTVDLIRAAHAAAHLSLALLPLFATDVAPALGAMANLTRLELYGYNTVVLAILRELPQRLRVLYLNGNKLQGLPQELGRIKALQVLDVGSNVLKYNINNWEFDWNW